MRHTSDESGLVADAEAVLGEPVVAAGVFALQDLIGADMAGGTVGAVGLDATLVTGAGALGAVIGGRAATKAAAAEQGVTIKLVVAVTTEKIYVLRWDRDTHPSRVVHTFDRATTSVDVTKFGLSRIVSLADAASGEHLELHASVAPYARQSGPDKDVLAELTGNHG